MDLDWREEETIQLDEDDDKDGAKGEDWLDQVVFHQVGSTLLERRPNLNPTDGTDFTERVIADGVSRFRVVRIPGVNGSAVLVDITLTLSSATASTTVQTSVRVGAGL